MHKWNIHLSKLNVKYFASNIVPERTFLASSPITGIITEFYQSGRNSYQKISMFQPTWRWTSANGALKRHCDLISVILRDRGRRGSETTAGFARLSLNTSTLRSPFLFSAVNKLFYFRETLILIAIQIENYIALIRIHKDSDILTIINRLSVNVLQ